MEFRFLHYVLFVLSIIPSLSAFISAFNPDLQIRIGKIYVAYQGILYINNPTNINYHIALSNPSMGVFLGLRTYMTSGTPIRQLEYSFQTTLLTLVGFQINAVFPNHITISQVFIDYFSSSNLNYFTIIPQLSNSSLVGQDDISFSTTTYFWRFQTNWTQHQSNILSIVSIVTTKIVFPQLMHFDFQFKGSKGTLNQYKISLVMKIGGIVQSYTKISVIVYCESCLKGLKDPYDISIIKGSSTVVGKAFSLEDLSFPSMFISLSRVKGNHSKLNFKITYSPNEYFQNNSYFYLQQNVREIFQTKYLGYPNITFFEFYLINVKRKNCHDQTSYPYLETQTQYCHDICPFGRFPNNDKVCLKCQTKCKTDITICQFCYQNGCIQTKYFNTISTPFTCSLCSLKITNCSNCFANSSGVYCTLCDVLSHTELINGQCLTCNSTSYFQQTDKICLSCFLKIDGCQTCSPVNGDICISCLVSSEKQLSFGVCIQCNNTSYYDPILKKCFLCSSTITNCVQCMNSPPSLICLRCDNTNLTQLVSNICQQCNITSYYDIGTQQCILCELTILNCQRCIWSGGTTCQLCYSHSSTIVNDGICVSCPIKTYFQSATRTCLNCSSHCKLCIDSTICIQCINNYELVVNICEESQVIKNSFFNQFHNNRQIISTILFNPPTDSILLDYSIEVFIDKIQNDYTIIFQDQYQIILNISFFKSLNSPILTLKFINKSQIYLQNQVLEQSLQSISYISLQEDNLYNTLNQGMSSFSLNFGSIFASTTLTTSTMYFISFIWSFQILSLYIFLQVKMPTNFQKFMNAMSNIQDVNLLPFNINNPMDQIQYHIYSLQKYEEMGVDLFFIRSILIKWIETSIYLLIYIIIYLCLFKIKSDNFIVRFLKRRFVKTFISNGIILIYSIIIDQVFSASVTVSENKFNKIYDIINNLSGICGILFMLFLIAFAPIYLYIKKKDRNIDTEDAYIGISRIKPFGQIGLFIFGFINITVCVCIPLFPTLFTIITVIFVIVSDIYFHLKIQCMKVKTTLVFRMIHHVCFIIYNLVFLVFVIGYQYYPNTNIIFFEVFGYLGMGSFVSTILFEFLQGFIEMLKDFYEFFKRQMSKCTWEESVLFQQKVIQLPHEFRPSPIDSIQQNTNKRTSKNSQQSLLNSKLPPIKINNRRLGFILKKAPKIFLHNSKSRMTLQQRVIYDDVKEKLAVKRMTSQIVPKIEY